MKNFKMIAVTVFEISRTIDFNWTVKRSELDNRMTTKSERTHLHVITKQFTKLQVDSCNGFWDIVHHAFRTDGRTKGNSMSPFRGYATAGDNKMFLSFILLILHVVCIEYMYQKVWFRYHWNIVFCSEFPLLCKLMKVINVLSQEMKILVQIHDMLPILQFWPI